MSDAEFLTAQQFCVETPLYKTFAVTEKNFDSYRYFASYEGAIESYCGECGRDTIFNIARSSYGTCVRDFDNWTMSNNYHDMYAHCSRNREHVARYSFKFDEVDGVTKIGQYPSMADADGVKLKKYRAVLDKELHSGFSKAVGLVSHGVGAGALVYLRRIFESLIEDAHTEAEKDPVWLELHEAEYANGRVADRVRCLKNYLPSYLVDHHTMYGVLSSGVHNMSEQECLELFPTLKIGIELILDQKIQKKEEAEKVAVLQKMLSGKASGSR